MQRTQHSTLPFNCSGVCRSLCNFFNWFVKTFLALSQKNCTFGRVWDFLVWFSENFLISKEFHKDFRFFFIGFPVRVYGISGVKCPTQTNKHILLYTYRSIPVYVGACFGLYIYTSTYKREQTDRLIDRTREKRLNANNSCKM